MVRRRFRPPLLLRPFLALSSPKLPRRLRRRLSESKSLQNCTVEDIEAKLRDADLHRQVSLSLSLFGVVLEYEDSLSTLLFSAVVVVFFFFFLFLNSFD